MTKICGNPCKVSVVIPVFNRKEYLKAMIICIINQTYKYWELLLVDDGSDGETIEMMTEYTQSDERIKVIQRERPPKGAPTCRNIGMENAAGEYIIFFDSDDLINKACLEQRVNFMESHKHIDFGIFPACYFDDLSELSFINNKNYELRRGAVGFECGKNILLSFLQGDYPFLIWTNIYKKQALEENSIRWDERFSIYQDFDFNIMVLINGLNFAFSNAAPDYYVRYHNQGSISSDIMSYEKCNSAMCLITKISDTIRQKTKYKKRHLYGFLLMHYNRITKNGYADAVSEYIKFCSSLFSGYFVLRLKIINFLVHRNRFACRIIIKLLFPAIIKLSIKRRFFERYINKKIKAVNICLS